MDSRLLPAGPSRNVGGTLYDFRRARTIGDLKLDIALTSPDDGCIALSHRGRKVELRCDTSFFRYVQLFVPPDRRSIALEPITAATNSFNLPELGLRVLAPGEESSGYVEVRLLSARDSG